ncbi:MAG: type I phosphomannose isomerase catalytic subunit [Brevinema sp.]
MKSYPMILETVYKTKVWGGRALETVLGKTLPTDELYGESWEASAHPNGLGTVLNGEYAGKQLPELLQNYGKELLGDTIYEKYQGKFPLLLKFLDINDKLSIQVHPSDAYALPNENSFGKAECWYVLSASDDAELFMGMKEGISKEEYLERAKNNDFDGMFDLVPVKKGDLVRIDPGVVHGSSKGSVLICELQQNSDITYRIYDFDREENGVKRPLHIEKSADVIRFDARPQITNFENAQDDEVVLLDWEYFSLKRVKLSSKITRPKTSSMYLYSILEGEMEFTVDGTSVSVSTGSGILVPANSVIEISGSGVFLEAYPK